MVRKRKVKERVNHIKIKDCFEHEEYREYALGNSYHLYLVGEYLKELGENGLAWVLNDPNAYYVSQELFGISFNLFVDHENLSLKLIGNSKAVSGFGPHLEEILGVEIEGVKLKKIRKFSQGERKLEDKDTITL